MPDAPHREPDRRRVRARSQQEESGVAEQLPQADEEEAGARPDVPDEGAHGSLLRAAVALARYGEERRGKGKDDGGVWRC